MTVVSHFTSENNLKALKRSLRGTHVTTHWCAIEPVFNSSSVWHCLSVQALCMSSRAAYSHAPSSCSQFQSQCVAFSFHRQHSRGFFNSGSIIFAQTSLQRFYSQMLSICKTQDCLASFHILEYISSKWRNNSTQHQSEPICPRFIQRWIIGDPSCKVYVFYF